MKVLVVDSGGRGHAICQKVAESNFADVCFWAPGSQALAGTGKIKPINIPATETEELIRFSKDNGIDLIILGPEDLLCRGFVNRAQEEKLKVYGPEKEAAILEGSKAFAKRFMKKYGIPTAPFKVFGDALDAIDCVRRRARYPLVVKADGLAAGKGVIICDNAIQAIDAIESIMIDRVFGEAGNKVVVEKFLPGEEASYIVMVDARGNILPLASSQDHKRVFDGDEGPNTGGMGAYSPAPVVTPDIEVKILERIVVPTIKGMKKENRRYTGFLYFGLMINAKGEPWLLEYNVRLGDPETQAILPRMQTDFVWLINQALIGNLDKYKIKWDLRPAVCIVMRSDGYPKTSTKGAVITGIEKARKTGAQIFYAAVGKNGKNELVTAGGRVLNITAKGPTFSEAQHNAYAAVKKIKCDKLFYRTDIGWRAVKRERRNQ